MQISQVCKPFGGSSRGSGPKDNHTFSSIAIARNNAFSLTGVGEAEQVNGEFVSSDFFPLLGVSPVVGRTFAAGEDEVGAGAVALISEGLWHRKFELRQRTSWEESSPSIPGTTPLAE